VKFYWWTCNIPELEVIAWILPTQSSSWQTLAQILFMLMFLLPAPWTPCSSAMKTVLVPSRPQPQVGSSPSFKSGTDNPKISSSLFILILILIPHPAFMCFSICYDLRSLKASYRDYTLRQSSCLHPKETLVTSWLLIAVYWTLPILRSFLLLVYWITPRAIPPEVVWKRLKDKESLNPANALPLLASTEEERY